MVFELSIATATWKVNIALCIFGNNLTLILGNDDVYQREQHPSLFLPISELAQELWHAFLA